ncbi:hypothetical protein GALL_172460 [mine drainage metagenome]|uniref:DinB superfamily protein n=1 Tax=mine drainage metagenome TaxID=410659 RepID=A0A1J5RX27_9ZZZZ
MLTKTLQQLFKRDLEKLKVEIESYHDEKKLWHVEKSISNSAGNLCLHLIGNLNHFIGAEFGKTGYVRDRPLEFSDKNVPRKILIEKINETINAVDMSLGKLTESQLQQDYPVIVFAEKMSNEFFLVHLAVHLSYHLGQINYHRRLLDA